MRSNRDWTLLIFLVSTIENRKDPVGCCKLFGIHNAIKSRLFIFSFKMNLHYGDSIRPLATLGWKPRQVRKEATVPSDACAKVRRIGLPPFTYHFYFFRIFHVYSL